MASLVVFAVHSGRPWRLRLHQWNRSVLECLTEMGYESFGFGTVGMYDLDVHLQRVPLVSEALRVRGGRWWVRRRARWVPVSCSESVDLHRWIDGLLEKYEEE